MYIRDQYPQFPKFESYALGKATLISAILSFVDDGEQLESSVLDANMKKLVGNKYRPHANDTVGQFIKDLSIPQLRGLCKLKNINFYFNFELGTLKNTVTTYLKEYELEGLNVEDIEPIFSNGEASRRYLRKYSCVSTQFHMMDGLHHMYGEINQLNIECNEEWTLYHFGINNKTYWKMLRMLQHSQTDDDLNMSLPESLTCNQLTTATIKSILGLAAKAKLPKAANYQGHVPLSRFINITKHIFNLYLTDSVTGTSFLASVV